jgi:uncharacterized protein (DUF736 family)
MTLPQPSSLRQSADIDLPGRSSRSRAATTSLKLDDPSFMAPIFANLFDDPDGESYT